MGIAKALGYYIFTLGCQQNVYDGEKIAFILDRLGHFPASQENANLIIILSCSVRQKAIDRIHGKIGYWRKNFQPKKIIITACLLPSEKKIFQSITEIIVPSDQIIDYLIKNYQAKEDFDQKDVKSFRTKDQKHSFVPITFGCNNFCTFCAVPLTRGRETSRQAEEIISKIQNLAKNGIENVTLLGQNVNSFGLSHWQPRDMRKNRNQTGKIWSATNPSPFVQLLKEVGKIENIKRISFLSPNPQDISGDLIDWMAKSPKFSRELNLPLQSGNDQILKKMNRRYSIQEYLALIQKIKQAIPDIYLSTDIIVGFPGETKKQFEDTIKAVKKVGFKKAFIGRYSPRPGTVSAKLYSDDVSAKEKKYRWETLNGLINKNGEA